jgi:hypothetical protein
VTESKTKTKKKFWQMPEIVSHISVDPANIPSYTAFCYGKIIPNYKAANVSVLGIK